MNRICIVIMVAIIVLFTSCRENNKDIYDDNSITTNDDTGIASQNSEKTNAVCEHDYICNKSTKKFHYSNCIAVERMSDDNKLYLHCTRDEVLSYGAFIPCALCCP